MTQSGALFYGDNLDVLRRYVDDESVDLVYLDPPFNSNASYNVLFAEQDGSQSAAQIKAFGDTWRWDQEAAAAYEEVVEGGGEVSRTMQAFRTILGESNMLAYLAMMAPRLAELHRAMKSTASLYLHCDPTASHYLKLLLDSVFGPRSFRSEIVWKRSSAHSDTKQGRRIHGHIHDVIFFYTKSNSWTWNPIYTPYDEAYVESKYRHIEPKTGRRYRLDNLTAAKPGGDTSYEWHGRHPYKGRYWAYSQEKMDKFLEEGRIRFPKKPDGVPELKRYLDEMPGVPLQDLWVDLDPINAKAAERLGYPTQKPESLLERIIESSSNQGDVVLDPFCGCGTSIAVSEKLKRNWVGIDITYLATHLIKSRLVDAFGENVDFSVIGEPTALEDASKLAKEDHYQFEAWALGLVGARTTAKKKGADRGIDGRLLFHEKQGGKTRQVLISVKSGTTGVNDVRDLRGVIEREEAEIGLLISMREPTKAMRTEAATAGFYQSGSEGVGTWGRHPRLQLLTVAELLDGRRIDMPPLTGNLTFRRAPRTEPRQPTTEPLFRNLPDAPEFRKIFSVPSTGG
ncbi:MAG TPA: DNA methyltransferase [Solirubrobacterales bacterium]|jgi:DNA modification methylase|nr:DNA methyltransferase [Solirubrobacterales bacterium]